MRKSRDKGWNTQQTGLSSIYWLNLNLNLYVAGPFSVDAMGESWDE